MTCTVPTCDNQAHAKGLCQTHYMRVRRYGDPDKVLISKAAAGAALKWFLDHVSHPDGPACLIWPFNRPDGRAQIWWEGKNRIAARVMCEIAHGPAPSSKHHAAHSCGNAYGGCIHPHHVRWATPKENEADKILHGTRAAGERHGMAKLTVTDIPEIRAASGTLYDIGDQFGISYSMAGKIRQRKNWKHVP